MPRAPESGTRIGFYGKLPSKGDFVHRGMPPEFIRIWDSWVAQGLSESRRRLGDAWDETYTCCPVWRFSLAPGICGKSGYTGIFIPSQDLVGRRFPVVILRTLRSREAVTAPLLADDASWYEHAADIAIAATSGAAMSLDQFDAALQGLEPVHDSSDLHLPPVILDWRTLTSLTGLASDLMVMGKRAANVGADEPLSYWWTEGREGTSSGWFGCVGLPHIRLFTEMLKGFSDEPPRERRPTRPVPAPQSAEETQPMWTAPVSATQTMSSSAICHVGKVRKTNQDTCLERTDIGLWMVADGVGGGRDGDRASQAICEMLQLLPAADSLEALADDVQSALRTVNAELIEDDRQYDDVCASTVVVLLIRDGRFAVIWAGDSRLYRLREQRLRLMTFDHSITASFDGASEFSEFKDLVVPKGNVITRAVGGAEELELELVYGDVKAGDCFLLCSDGVYRELPEPGIAEILSQAVSPEAASQHLQEEVLRTPAKDNFTALVVTVR